MPSRSFRQMYVPEMHRIEGATKKSDFPGTRHEMRDFTSHAFSHRSGQALAIVSQICDALQFARDQGIVRRGIIKQENFRSGAPNGH
ncbi:MAG: hypothetical protein Q8Q59_10690 [Luteolibacter sp.]|nr:hypothetical protein [Luteolibacter sp.]